MNDRERWRERVRDICAIARHDDDESWSDAEFFFLIGCLIKAEESSLPSYLPVSKLIDHCRSFNTKSFLFISELIMMITFLNKPELVFFLYIVKWFHIILNNSVKWFQVLLCITNNSIKHQPSVYIQLNDQKVLFQTIQFSISVNLYWTQLNLKAVNFKLFSSA